MDVFLGTTASDTLFPATPSTSYIGVYPDGHVAAFGAVAAPVLASIFISELVTAFRGIIDFDFSTRHS